MCVQARAHIIKLYVLSECCTAETNIVSIGLIGTSSRHEILKINTRRYFYISSPNLINALLKVGKFSRLCDVAQPSLLRFIKTNYTQCKSKKSLLRESKQASQLIQNVSDFSGAFSKLRSHFRRALINIQ